MYVAASECCDSRTFNPPGVPWLLVISSAPPEMMPSSVSVELYPMFRNAKVTGQQKRDWEIGPRRKVSWSSE